MEDFGDIIYWLLIIVAAIGSILGKSKKKKHEAEAEQQKKTVFEELEQSWEEFEATIDRPLSDPIPATPSKPYVSPFESQPKPTIEPMKYETLKHEPLSYDNADDFSELRVKKRIKESVFKKQSTLRVVDLDNETEDAERTLNISLDNQEDAKMAFIYSEIFNRKYN